LQRRLGRDPDADPALAATIETIVARYATSGQIDDAAFAVSRAARLVRRGVAPAVIRGRLGAEGLDAASALAEVDGDPGLRAASALVRRRRLGPYRATPDPAGDLAKLGRAGFPYELATRVLAMSREAIEEAARGPGARG